MQWLVHWMQIACTMYNKQILSTFSTKTRKKNKVSLVWFIPRPLHFSFRFRVPKHSAKLAKIIWIWRWKCIRWKNFHCESFKTFHKALFWILCFGGRKWKLHLYLFLAFNRNTFIHVVLCTTCMNTVVILLSFMSVEIFTTDSCLTPWIQTESRRRMLHWPLLT